MGVDHRECLRFPRVDADAASGPFTARTPTRHSDAQTATDTPEAIV